MSYRYSGPNTQSLWDFPALTRRHCDVPQAFQFLDSNLPPDSNHFGQGDWGALAI